VAINSINGYSSTLRISGLASGLDTEQIISDLMKAERIPLDRLYQKRQLIEWKSEAYRDITALLKGFKDEYFDVLKPDTYMLSQSIYQKFTALSSDENTVTATGGAGITSMSHTIIVNKLATASKAVSTETVSKPLAGENVDSFTVNSYDNSFKLTYNGVTKIITVPNGTYTDAAAIVGNGSDGLLKQKVKEAFSGLDVTVEDGAIKFITKNISDELTVYRNDVMDNLLSDLGLNTKGEGNVIAFPVSIAAGREFAITVTEGDNTTTVKIKWDSDKVYNSSEELADDIQAKINASVGEGKISVEGSGGKLTFIKSESVDSFSLANRLKNDEILGKLGFEAGNSNKLSLNDTIGKISTRLDSGIFVFDEGGKLNLSINGKNIQVNAEDTLSTLIYKVYNSQAGVKMSYSAYTDTFTLESTSTGEGTITLNDNGSGFFNAVKLTDIVDGEDAEFVLDGIEGTRSSNSFTVDGVNYTLLEADPGVEKTITLSRDTDSVFNSIKGFIDKYNEVIDKINGKLTEKYDRNYQPLTQEQKDELSEDEVKKWEERAKTGLLRNDSLLQQIVYEMRKALYDSVKDLGVSLSSIGITTGSYSSKGKLEINETRLREAINSNPEEVMNLFAKKSNTVPSYTRDLSAEDRAVRYSEQGIIGRISDILEDNISIYRDKNGSKGKLLQKAGMESDSSQFSNILYEQIMDYDEQIKKLTEKLIDKENAYYAKFTAMEKYIAQMNAQSNWLMMQFNMG
jgi:flagellar hook-associated protein 2